MEESIQHRKPVFSFSAKYVKKGAIAALEILPREIGEQAGELAREIMEKSMAASVNLHAEKYRLSVDKKIARKYGLDLSRVTNAEFIE